MRPSVWRARQASNAQQHPHRQLCRLEQTQWQVSAHNITTVPLAQKLPMSLSVQLAPTLHTTDHFQSKTASSVLLDSTVMLDLDQSFALLAITVQKALKTGTSTHVQRVNGTIRLALLRLSSAKSVELVMHAQFQAWHLSAVSSARMVSTTT
jgi:hypothetical protein